MKKLGLFIVSAVSALILSANAMALGSIGAAVEYTDLGKGASFAAPGIKASFTIFEPLPLNTVRATVGYYGLSGQYTSNGVPVTVSFTNLQYGLTYNVDLVFIDLYAQAGFDNLNGNVTGSIGGFTGNQSVATSSMYYGGGLNLKPFPFITIGADARFVNGLFGANTSNTILTAGINLNI